MVLLPAAALLGCAGLRMPAQAGPELGDARTLTAAVSELHLHLRDDTYRFDRARTEGGQNVFALTLWRLDRLRARRALPPAGWENVDVVIEYARAKALERLRRYADARKAYLLVASTGSRLAAAAREAQGVMELFAQHSGPFSPPPATQEEAVESIEDRIRTWLQLALDTHGTGFDFLAREEAEAWEMVRVDWVVRHRSAEEAIRACRRLVERHHASKLHPKHLIRLGDLYAEAARRIYLRARANLAPFDAEQYEAFLDHAFSAYELAGEAPVGSAHTEADSKIEALLAQHEGIRGHVQ